MSDKLAPTLTFVFILLALTGSNGIYSPPERSLLTERAVFDALLAVVIIGEAISLSLSNPN